MGEERREKITIYSVFQITPELTKIIALIRNLYVFSSADLKAQVSFFDRLFFVFYQCVRPSLRLKSFHHRAFSIELCTHHSWVKAIQVYSNKGPCPFTREDNSDIVKIQSVKMSISIKFGIKHSMKECVLLMQMKIH